MTPVISIDDKSCERRKAPKGFQIVPHEARPIPVVIGMSIVSLVALQMNILELWMGVQYFAHSARYKITSVRGNKIRAVIAELIYNLEAT